MILVDTSVWIEYLRGSARSVARQTLRKAIQQSPAELCCTAPIRMELRMGGDDIARRRIEDTLDGLQQLAVLPEDDFELAADLFRAARRSGHTIRASVDCLIAAVALRSGATLLHRDADFDRIASVAPGLVVQSLVPGAAKKAHRP